MTFKEKKSIDFFSSYFDWNVVRCNYYVHARRKTFFFCSIWKRKCVSPKKRCWQSQKWNKCLSWKFGSFDGIVDVLQLNGVSILFVSCFYCPCQLKIIEPFHDDQKFTTKLKKPANFCETFRQNIFVYWKFTVKIFLRST